MPSIAHPVYYPRISMTVICLSVSISVPFAGGTVVLAFRCGSRPCRSYSHPIQHYWFVFFTIWDIIFLSSVDVRVLYKCYDIYFV